METQEKLQVSQVVDRLQSEVGITVTRQTIANWTARGSRGIKLPIAGKKGYWRLYHWSDVLKFLRDIAQEKPHPTPQPKRKKTARQKAAEKKLGRKGGVKKH